MNDQLKISRNGDVQTFIIDRPTSGNSLSPDLVEAFHAALDAFEREGDRVLILRGEGRNFCTGFDLSDAADATEGELLRRFVRIEQLLARLWTFPVATIAVGRGRVMGAGADLFAACNCRIAVADASFAFPGAGFGLVLGSRRLARRIGDARALHLIASGETISATTAYDLRLATALVTEAELEARLEKEVIEARRLDPATYRFVLHAVLRETSELDSDMAALVRSAVRPGLRDRIVSYRARSLRPHRTATTD